MLIKGNESIMKMPKALIINSRQSKTPVGDDNWVRNTIHAIKSAIQNNHAVISSIGMNTWELLLWATREYNGFGIVILNIDKKTSESQTIENICKDYDLNDKNFSFVFVEPSSNRGGKKAWWENRDAIALEMSDYIYPVSIREGGRWSSFLQTCDSKTKEIDYTFKTEYLKERKKRADIQIKFEVPNVENWEWITHWTRRFYKPWPGEKASDFYRAIVSSEGRYPRMASDTLKRIIIEMKLRGSGDKIRNGQRVVAFTALKPSESIKLMRWRSRYVRYTFEPYGIAIKKEAAIDLGIRPVEYLKSSEIHSSDETFIQGYGKGDWTKELELRYDGDFDLRLLDSSDVRIIIPSIDEKPEFKAISHFQILTLDNLNVMSFL